jgi:hypothetical protein
MLLKIDILLIPLLANNNIFEINEDDQPWLVTHAYKKTIKKLKKHSGHQRLLKGANNQPFLLIYVVLNFGISNISFWNTKER